MLVGLGLGVGEGDAGPREDYRRHGLVALGHGTWICVREARGQHPSAAPRRKMSAQRPKSPTLRAEGSLELNAAKPRGELAL